VQALFDLLATLSFWALTLYEWIIIIAILVTWVSADPRNPIVQFLNNMTVPFWDWLGRWLPRPVKLFRAYISLLVIWFLQVFVPGVLRTVGGVFGGQVGLVGFPVHVVGYFLLGLGIVLQNLFFFLILLLLIWFFLTLINPSLNNPIVRTIAMLVDPFITPFQRRLPRMRVDVSPLLAAGVFLLLNVFVVSQLIGFSHALTGPGMTPGGGGVRLMLQAASP